MKGDKPEPIKQPSRKLVELIKESLRLKETIAWARGTQVVRSDQPMAKDKPKILIAAEWDGIGEYLSSFLEDQDFKVAVVAPKFDSLKILSALSEEAYAIVVLTDNSLKSQQLPDVVSEVKNKYPKVYCVVMAGEQKPDFVIELERRGVDDYLPMPFTTEYLLSRIEKAIQVLSEETKVGQIYGSINIQERFSKSGQGAQQGYVPGQTQPGQVFTHTNGKKYKVDPSNPGDPNDPYVIPTDDGQ